MNADKTHERIEFERRVHDEMLDSFDEELEMEIDDDRMNELIGEATASAASSANLERHFYFKELFRLQGELVKLQDWVVHNKLKVVVLFEGRDAAGKAPFFSPQPARLSRRGTAGAKRARTQPVVFPALRLAPARRRRNRPVRPQLVQPRRRGKGHGLLQ
jgi:hypothetical protein